jgi:hypothetical protein
VRRSKACLYIGELTTGTSPRVPTMPRESTDAPLKGSTLERANTSPSKERKTATAEPSTRAATPPSSGITSTAHTGVRETATAVMRVLPRG